MAPVVMSVPAQPAGEESDPTPVAKEALPSRIVLFTLKECPHCKRAKALLDELGLEWEEISLTDYPEKRTDMLQLADRLTVPQIFITGRHIGGAADLRELYELGELRKLYHAEFTSKAYDPGLRRPSYPPKREALPEKAPEPTVCIGGECLEYPALMQVLLSGVDSKDHTCMLGLRTVKRSFQGKEMVAFLQKRFQMKTRGEGVQAARDLMQSGVFSTADGANTTFKDDGSLFRFQAHHSGMWAALNASRKASSQPDAGSNPLGVLARLKGELWNIITNNSDPEGQVDYVAAAADPGFITFELDVCELQAVHLSALPEKVRKPFCINLYNTIVPHAFIKVGIPNTNLSRVAFFDSIGYELGGDFYPLNDIENGVLRGNRTAPFHLRRPFKQGSKQMADVLPCDHRIHFALNCGARSCPPVKWFTAESIDDELRVVAMAWVEQESNVRVDLRSNTLWLSKICQWYSADFGASKTEVAATLLSHMRGTQFQLLQELMRGPFQIKYLSYDWSSNSSRSLQFSEVCLKCFFSF